MRNRDRKWMGVGVVGIGVGVGMVTLLAGISVPWSNSAQAKETKGPLNSRVATPSGTADYEVDGINKLVIGNRHLEIPIASGFSTDANANFEAACKEFSADKLPNSICHSEDQKVTKHAEMFASASKALGIPQVILLCMTGVESGFLPNVTSKDGAHSEGLAQVTKETAPIMADLYAKNKHGFKNVAWENYTKNFTPPSWPNEKTVRSTELRDAPVQIFTMAMYLRNSIIDDEQTLKSLGLKPFNGTRSADLKTLKKFTHYLIASYNGGEGLGREYLNNGMDDTSITNKYTPAYFERVDKCLEQMSKVNNRKA